MAREAHFAEHSVPVVPSDIASHDTHLLAWGVIDDEEQLRYITWTWMEAEMGREGQNIAVCARLHIVGAARRIREL